MVRGSGRCEIATKTSVAARLMSILRPDEREFLKETAADLRGLLLIPLGVIALWLLWYSPGIITYSRVWYHYYEYCVVLVKQARPSMSLKDAMVARRVCAKVATKQTSR